MWQESNSSYLFLFLEKIHSERCCNFLWLVSKTQVVWIFFSCSYNFLDNAGFELVGKNRFAKNGLPEAKNFLDLWIILWKMQRVLTKFCELIWSNTYYESLVIQQGVFNRPKINCYVASSMNNSENLWSIWLSDLQFLEKMQKLICKLPKHFAICELRTANSNPAMLTWYFECNIWRITREKIFVEAIFSKSEILLEFNSILEIIRCFFQEQTYGVVAVKKLNYFYL